MAATGEIRNLYIDRERTQVLLPRTKTKAVTNDEGVSLDALLAGITPDSIGAVDKTSHSLDNRSVKVWAISLDGSACAYATSSTTDMPASVSGTASAYAIISATVIEVGHWIELRATFITSGCKAVLIYNNGWGEWEWENPPMLSGVEYRTTERYNNEAVYVRRVDYGYLASGEHSIPHGIENINEVIGLEMINKTYGIYTSYFNCTADRTNVTLNTPWSMGGLAYIIKYTKL